MAESVEGAGPFWGRAPSGVANTLLDIDEGADLDASASRLLSHRSILATLMGLAVRELQGVPPEVIQGGFLPEDALVRRVAVDQDAPDAPGTPPFPPSPDGEGEAVSDGDSTAGGGTVTPDGDAVMLDGDAMVEGGDTASKTIREGSSFFDVVVTVRLPPPRDRVRIIADVEVQSDRNIKRKYRPEARAIYYCSRLISMQKNRTFRHDDYHKIQKCYSIWICPDSETGEDGVTRYRLEQGRELGRRRLRRATYDRQEIVVVTLTDGSVHSGNRLVRFLGLLFSRGLPVEERMRRLEEEYHIAMTRDLREEMVNMCSYSAAVLDVGIKEGERRGEIKTLASFVRDNIITLAQAAEMAGVSEEEFRAEAERYGKQLPPLVGA